MAFVVSLGGASAVRIRVDRASHGSQPRIEVRTSEISADVVGLNPVSGQEVVLAVCSCDVYSLESLDQSIRHVADAGRSG